MNLFTVVCCSVLRREIEEVLRQDYPEAQTVFLDSMLHMHPEKLREAMEETLEGMPGQACLLVYGDCHAYMREIERKPLRARTEGVNCSDLLLGREMYKKYQKEKPFFFLPEWTRRWREVFERELGFTDQSLAREFMRENRSELIYLDTGCLSVPEETLKEIAGYFGMPMHVLPVSLDHLRAAVRSAAQRLEQGGSPDEP